MANSIQEVIDNITIYDNGGKTLDRYSVILNNYKRRSTVNGNSVMLYECLGMNEGGHGFSQFCEAVKGRHLGKKVNFNDLSKATQDHIIERLA